MAEIDAAHTPRLADRFSWIVCLLWLVLAVDHALLLPGPLFPLDDAYIAMHNAGALVAGDDPSFRDASPLLGATSLVHLLLVAAMRLVLPPAWASWTITWLALLAGWLGLCRLARTLSLPWYLTALLVWLWLWAADSAYQLLNGIETGLAMAAVLWACALRLEPAARRPWLLPVLIGVLPLVRPELVLLSAALWIERGITAPRGERARRMLQDAAFAALPLAPGLLAYLWSTGAPVPRTFSVKRDFFGMPCAGSGFALRWFGSGLAQFLSRLNVTAFGLLLLSVRPLHVPGVAFALALCAACLAAFPEAVGHNYYRYLYPLLPLCLVGFAHAWFHSHGWKRRAVTVAAGCAAVGSLVGIPRSTLTYLADLTLTEQQLEPVAAFVRAQLPAAAPVLVHDIGYMSTAVPNPLVDVVGLKDRRAAELHRTLTATSCAPDARAQVVERLALDRGARHFVVFAEWDGLFRLSDGLRRRGWTLTALREPDVAYQVYHLKPPERVR